jgi:hypothetical protein
MRYVHRREDGTIASVHETPQEGYADEVLADDDPELVAWLAAAYAPAMPPRVSAGAFVRALYETDRIAAVKAAVAQAGGLAEDLWLHAASFVRADPLVAQIGAAIGMSAEDIDDLFRRAGVHDREIANG